MVAAYNTSDKEKTCRLFEGGRNTATFQVPPRRLIAWSADKKVPPALLAAVQTLPSPPAIPPPSGPPVLTTIQVEPSAALISDKATQKFVAKGLDQFGKPFAITPAWSVQGKGSVDANGLFTPNGGGNFVEPHSDVIAKANEMEGRAWAAVEESRHPSKIILTPEAPRDLKLAANSKMKFRAEAVDQFKARYLLPVKWTSTGNVSVSPEGEVTAGQPGDAAFTVEAGDQKVTVRVKVLSPDQVNLATLKPVTASSSENGGTEAHQAVDGNDKTRWGSAFSDPQWIMVDLEKTYGLKKVVLNWQNAAAKVYELELSNDGSHWSSAAKVDDGKPGVRTFDLNSVKARYLRVTGTQRTTGYGYSLYEIEAYGTP
ncbi:MAG: discoidin domain-containing protein [Chthoniobacterales bacterium]|nr:discoidin domain-containing protein [Chthoniobacterales bacterium]